MSLNIEAQHIFKTDILPAVETPGLVGLAEQKRRQIISLTGCVAKVSLFAGDGTDEFTVQRASGPEGIFKTWAVPVIPFLENGSLNDLSLLSVSTGKIHQTLKNWEQSMIQKPVAFGQILEKWLDFSLTYDRRLSEIYTSRPLPDQPADRVAELYLRLVTAFGYASPFYHLEAMVGDANSTLGNPVKPSLSQDNSTRTGGSLDVVAMLLPSALRDKVIAGQLSWNGLDWDKINALSQPDPKDEAWLVCARLARKLGVPPADIVFAANVLEWIPSDVGGKKADLGPDAAQKSILGLLDTKPEPTVASIARDINARIRFLNWLPSVRSGDNFTKAAGWTYSAVCDTADQLLGELGKGECFNTDINDEFIRDLLPQLTHLDAASAKGRLILSLVGWGGLKPEFQAAISKRSGSFLEEISHSLAAREQSESVVPIKNHHSRTVVGGKAVGLTEAMEIFGPEQVSDGLVVTSEAVNRWLDQLPGYQALIKEFNNTGDINTKLGLASQINRLISSSEFNPDIAQRLRDALPNGLSALRSSSSDEDTLWNGSAAGIYDSKLNIPPDKFAAVIPEVVASFFSEKAVSYRFLHGLTDRPQIAVIASPMLAGRGGAIFTDTGKDGYTLNIGETPDAVVSNSGAEIHTVTNNNGRTEMSAGFIDEQSVLAIGQMALAAKSILGGEIDIEFVIPDHKPTILQMRSLNNLPPPATGVDPVHDDVFLDDLAQLDDLQIPPGPGIRLVLRSEADLDKFQGGLFRFLVTHQGRVTEIQTSQKVAPTSHFSNICANLGIKVSSDL